MKKAISRHLARLKSDELEKNEKSLINSSETSFSHAKAEVLTIDDRYKGYTEEQKHVIEGQIVFSNSKPLSLMQLMTYDSKRTTFLLIIGTILAIIAGVALPLTNVVLGTLVQAMTSYLQLPTPENAKKFKDKYSLLTLYLIAFALATFMAVFVYSAIFILAGERITRNLRKNYLTAVLSQNIGFFDKLGVGTVINAITTETDLVQEGISHKLGYSIALFSTFVSALVISFIYQWKFTLILFSLFPGSIVALGVGGTLLGKCEKASLDLYSEASTIAQEVFSSIRTVYAFGTNKKLSKLYDEKLFSVRMAGKSRALSLGAMLAGIFLTINCMLALSILYGSRLYMRNEIDVQKLIIVLYSMFISSFSAGLLIPNIPTIISAMKAANKMFTIIHRKSPIDVMSDDGAKLDQVEGEIVFKNVYFAYPNRPEVTVTKDLNMHFPKNKTTAIIGASGSGKSTVIGLVERFYDPYYGQVLFDGVPIQTLNLTWYRQNLSLVKQEPVLFAGTIYENVVLGLVGSEFENADENVKRDKVTEACKLANAHDFVSQLPNGYETFAGEGGSLLSGGQKQRVAIARAVIKNPKVLLLDEATSALDSKSEHVVQDALERASKSRTTIVIAHRLSTVVNADNIIVMSKGVIMEQGKHLELLEKKGLYYNMVNAQNLIKIKHEEKDTQAKQSLDEGLLVNTQKVKIDIGKEITNLSITNQELEAQTFQERSGFYYMVKLVSMLKKDWRKVIVGFIASGLCGFTQAGQSLIFAQFLMAIVGFVPGILGSAENFRNRTEFLSIMFFVFAIFILIAYFSNGYALEDVTEVLIQKIRSDLFEKILTMEVSFFDREENNPGALTTLLSSDAKNIQGFGGGTLGSVNQSLVAIIGGSILGLAVGWKLALVFMAILPLMILEGYLQFALLQKFEEKLKEVVRASANYASEAVGSIQTVASLTLEKTVQKRYFSQLDDAGRAYNKSNFIGSILYGVSRAVPLLVSALAYRYGSKLIYDREYSIYQFYVTFLSIVIAGESVGQVFAFTPNMGKAKQASKNVFGYLGLETKLDADSKEGLPMPSQIDEIQFSNVHFSYPTRPMDPVLRGINMTIKPGSFVALVGPSGCGKTTSLTLLERFYDPVQGTITLNGQNLCDYNVKELRKSISLVSQEPTLYDGSIRMNIMLGANERASEEDLIQVCKMANIYEFIQSLPQGFDTLCGRKGGNISGGQKQRIAIARALIRKPRILLLDEATSALDTESEKVVQKAIDIIAKGQTTISVAHRLSTIKDADVIFVFNAGKIVEFGGHEELIAKDGLYADMVQQQKLEEQVH